MSALPSTTTLDEYLNEQLINCINIQTNVIQNLAQYSQHISLQLFEIKNNVNILANRILTLEEQQSYIPIYPPPYDPLWFLQLAPTLYGSQIELPADPIPFSFTNNAQPSHAAPFVFGPLSSNNVTHLDEEYEDDESPISFEPVVHLSPGEEDENIVFCERAKLYHFDISTNQLKERGSGEMKILQHKINHHCRIFMRLEQVHRICAYHRITSQLELQPHQGIANAYIWSVVDFADGEGKYETFCVKFKADDQAKQFARMFNKSKENTGDLPLIGRISLDDDDVIPIGEIKPTHEQIERARKLQLPSTFYLYESKPPCKGCRGCWDESPLNDIQLSNQINSNFPSAFFPNSTLPSLMSMLSTWSPDGPDSSSAPVKDSRMIVKAKRALPSNRMPPPSVASVPSYEQPSSEISRGNDARISQMNQKKSRNFSGQNPETTPSFDNYASKVAENILDRAKQELSKQTQIVTPEDINSKSTSSSSSHSGFSFTNFQLSTNPSFSFSNTSDLSFADLIKQSSPNTDEADDPYEPTISYKPIVQLSPVEVKTGEEDENILFCERAKLYRFDASANQMKERGIGEMKILEHKTTHQFRVLMRREQVLKICANHIITPQLELKPHQGSENAYVWSVMDSSDGNAKHETLCVKFKTSDIAKRFLQQFNDAKIVK